MAEARSLKTILRDSIIKNVVDCAFSNMKQKSALMVVDDTTTKILDYCMKVHMLNDRGVGVIVNVKYVRERVRIPPIYFLSPSVESIQGLISDYENESKLQYGAPIHLFLCGSVTNEIMELIKNSNLARFLKSFSEVYCDFLAVESNVFSFGREQALVDLFLLGDSKKRQQELERCSDNLVCLMTSINEDPYIRYSSQSQTAADLAQMFQVSFTQKKAAMEGFKPEEDRATLLILDRSEEPEVPLIHELTYQSMIQDLLDCEGKYLKYIGDDGNDEQFFFEEDPVWPDLFLESIAGINTLLKSKFEHFKANSAMAKQQEGGDSANMLKAIRDLPMYKKMAKSFNTHFKLYKDLSSSFSTLNLMDVSDCEMSMVTGMNDEGGKAKQSNIQASMNQLLQEPKLPSHLKLRLIMLYIITQGGVTNTIRDTLFESAGLDDKEIQAVLNLAKLKVPLDASLGGRKPKRFQKDMTNRAKALMEEAEKLQVVQSRFEPEVSFIIKHQADNPSNLDAMFPYCGDKWKPKKDAGQNLRSGRFGGMFSRKPKASASKKSANKGSRIIICVVGGVCFSEIRQAYLYSKRLGRDVFIGGTSTLQPRQFLANLETKADEIGFSE